MTFAFSGRPRAAWYARDDLERRLDAFRTTAGQMRPGQVRGQPVGGEAFEEPLPLRGQPRRHRVRATQHRVSNDVGHLGPTVADVRHDRAASGIEDASTVVEDEFGTAGFHDPRRFHGPECERPPHVCRSSGWGLQRASPARSSGVFFQTSVDATRPKRVSKHKRGASRNDARLSFASKRAHQTRSCHGSGKRSGRHRRAQGDGPGQPVASTACNPRSRSA